MKDIPTAFLPMGGPLCPHKKKKLYIYIFKHAPDPRHAPELNMHEHL